MATERTNHLVKTLALALGLAIAALVVGACGSGSENVSSADGPTTSIPTSGAGAYAMACSSCHGADGSGGQGPAIGRTLAASKYDQATLAALIANGKGAMQGYAGDLPPETIDQIAQYVRTELGQ